MREIKFRGLSHDGRWVYTSKQSMINFEGGFLYSPGQGEGAVVVPLKDGSIGQYTGLKDKNGVEIFKGDILSGRCHNWDAVNFGRPNETANVVVVWYQGNVEYITVDVEEYVRGVRDEPNYIAIDEPWSEREVIGNIYEHPHLLEDK